jgi:peptidoglycan/LPS O-acetylase OafA/YrhL
MRRSIAAVLALLTVLNGSIMLSAGPAWYASVPGVSETGPYNPHFVSDIGAAFLVAGLALAARAWRPRYWPAAVAGSAFLAAHALIHLAMIAGGHDHHAAIDLIAIVLPSALALFSAFPTPRELTRERTSERAGERHA